MYKIMKKSHNSSVPTYYDTGKVTHPYNFLDMFSAYNTLDHDFPNKCLLDTYILILIFPDLVLLH